LHVTEGAGLAQARGEQILELRPGQSIVTPPDEWHWHGAAPDNFMAHLSITEGVGSEDRPESVWGALVTDDEYRGEQH